MDTLLWILQVLMALMFVLAGINHGFRQETMKANPMMAWMKALPAGLLTFIGTAEILGGIGLVLPAITGILTWLTPLAALGLAIVMLLAMLFHFTRREYPNIAFNLILFALVAFIAYGRLVLAPLYQ